MGKWIGKWLGGRLRAGRHGKTSWVLERQVQGERHRITLEVDSETAALAELALFERDPEAYLTKSQARAEGRTEALLLDQELAQSFLKFLAGETDKTQKPRSKKYRANIRTYLVWWQNQLAGKDLRKVKLAQLHTVLDAEPNARKHKIITIKSFSSWLRRTGRLDRTTDATLDLVVPTAMPEQASRVKGYPMARLEKLYSHVADQAVRDVLQLRARTGLHHTEIDRLARGDGQLRAVEGQGEIAGVLAVAHKKGVPHLIAVEPWTLAAAQRLRARGSAPVESWVYKQLDEAAKEARSETIAPGELRHSYATWAENEGREVRPKRAGVPLQLVASTMGHETEKTTHLHYRGTHRIPIMVALPLKLEHAADPKPEAATASSP